MFKNRIVTAILAALVVLTMSVVSNAASLITPTEFSDAFTPILDTVKALLVPGLGIMATLFAVYMVPRIFKHFAHGG